MAFFNVRSKLISTLVKNPTRLISQYGIHQKQPKSCVFLLGSSLCRSFFTDLFRSKLERIPYSGKFCFVSPEKFRRTHFFLAEKEFRKWGIVPSSDQRVMEVGSIGRKIKAAMNEGLMLDEAYKINGKMYEPPRRKMWEQRTLIWKPVTKHLNGIEWEFYVAERMPYSSISVFRTGKIIISATLFHGNITTAQREAFIATAIRHQIGKVVGKGYGRRKFVVQFHTLVLQ